MARPSFVTDQAGDDTVFFSNFNNITGSDADDFFYFGPGSSVTGTLDGMGGNNTLDFQHGWLQPHAAVESGDANHHFGEHFSGRQFLVAKPSDINSLTGSNLGDTLKLAPMVSTITGKCWLKIRAS